MYQGNGRCACAGVTYGTIVAIASPKPSIADTSDAYLSVEEELELFHKGLEKAKAEIAALVDKAHETLGAEQAEIFEIHQMMLDDPDISEAIEDVIKNGAISAVQATRDVGMTQARDFEALDDDYMRQRANDIKDVTERIIRSIEGTVTLELTEPSIIVADDLLPSQTVALDRSLILGFVLRQGTQNSHASILARTMNIPLLINAVFPDSIDGFALGKDGDLTALNGHQLGMDSTKGVFYLDPDRETIEQLKLAKDQFETIRLRHLALRGTPSISAKGHTIKTFANIGLPDDVEQVLENDAEGIGLFRSEFLYLGRSEAPSEEEQYRAYAKVGSTMNGKLVIIRTLDIGADKKVNYFKLPSEDNPALGMRALRICLTQPDIFKAQLRALYRAAARGNIAIMLPMVTRLKEVEQAKALCDEVEQELKNENIEYKKPLLGIMIETPAAAILSYELGKHVDFFSIGTNDLTQYTTACDRQNKHLGEFFDPHHEAVLALLKLVAENAHKAGIPVGICGELASDPDLTDFFIECGFDELSVSPGAILGLRERIIHSQAVCHNKLLNPRITI